MGWNGKKNGDLLKLMIEQNFDVEVGFMDYGFELHGILGLNFLRATKAVIDLDLLELR